MRPSLLRLRTTLRASLPVTSIQLLSIEMSSANIGPDAGISAEVNGLCTLPLTVVPPRSAEASTTPEILI
jgi:hypothetical protein